MDIRQQIPEVQGITDVKAKSVLNAIRSIINNITGRSTKPIRRLGADATLSGVINKVNEIIDALQETPDANKGN
jgi:hypothetical protein